MRTKTLWIAIGLGVASLDCASEEAPHAGAATTANPASCEAMVDHRIGQCPEDAKRLFEITLCEEDRAAMAPIGCSQPLADYVLCQTEAELDCESGEPLGCADELMSLQSCRQQFAIHTSCSRAETRDADDCGDTGRFSFICLDLSTLQAPNTPSHCELIHEPGIFCCDSFTNDTLNESLFIDPRARTR
jgi:hypothetical protein